MTLLLSSMMAGLGALGFGVMSVVGTEAVQTGGSCIASGSQMLTGSLSMTSKESGDSSWIG